MSLGTNTSKPPLFIKEFNKYLYFFYLINTKSSDKLHWTYQDSSRGKLWLVLIK